MDAAPRHDQYVTAPAVSALLGDRRAAAGICVVVGMVPFVHWSVADLSHDETAQQHQWLFVLFFSAVVLVLGAGMLVVAHQAPVPGALRTARFLALVAVAASLTNLVEDGLRVEAMFFAFVAELLALQIGFAVLAVLIVVRGKGAERLWAVAPIATAAAILLYIDIGGPLMAVTWLVAALACLVRPRRVVAAAG
jgi:hypothetical protein